MTEKEDYKTFRKLNEDELNKKIIKTFTLEMMS